MNELIDRIEAVVLDAARRRAARRRRRTVLAVATIGLLLLVSGASALTGVGPLGEALTADENLPPGAKPDPRGESALLVGHGADGHRYEVRVYRAKPDTTGRLRALPGARHYCAASYSANARGKLDPISIICTLGADIAARVVKRGLWLDCSGRGGVVGDPAPPDPVCGLTLASTTRLTIEPNRGSAGEVKLSAPFGLRVNHDPEIIGRESLTPRDVARLPRVLRVRAVLGVVEAPLTQPGENAPRTKVTAESADGSTHVAYVGGRRVPERDDYGTPDATPQPGGARVALSVSGIGGVLWRTEFWRARHDNICATATPEGVRPPAPEGFFSHRANRMSGCLSTPSLGTFRTIVRRGASAAVTHVPAARSSGGQAVYGYAAADVRRLSVRDTEGRHWPAKLSRPWTTWRRRPGDLEPIPPKYRPGFAGLPRSIRLRAFVGVIPADATPRYGVHLRYRAER